MSHPQPLADLVRPIERDWACLDCGGAIRQNGFAGASGKGAMWSPVRCLECAGIHLDQRAADEARRRIEDDKQRRDLSAARFETRRAEALAALKVPDIFADATLESFELHGSGAQQLVQERALTNGRRYLSDWPETQHLILILRGGFGTGKGHWTWSVVKALVREHAIKARVVKLADLVRQLRRSWRDQGAMSEEEVLELYRGVDLLAIDEVSRHAFYGENIHQHLYDVLDFRMEHSRPTILTTNETDDGIRAVLRDAIWDRVWGSGGVIEFGEASYRQKRAADRASIPSPGATP